MKSPVVQGSKRTIAGGIVVNVLKVELGGI